MSIFLFPIFFPPNSRNRTQCWWNGTFTYQVYPKNDQLYKKRSGIFHCSCGPFLVSPWGCILTRRLIIVFTSYGTRKSHMKLKFLWSPRASLLPWAVRWICPTCAGSLKFVVTITVCLLVIGRRFFCWTQNWELGETEGIYPISWFEFHSQSDPWDFCIFSIRFAGFAYTIYHGWLNHGEPYSGSAGSRRKGKLAEVMMHLRRMTPLRRRWVFFRGSIRGGPWGPENPSL